MSVVERSSGLRRSVLLLLLLATVACAPAARADGLTTVIVVRHAEKVLGQDDPPLSESGEARARALARLVGDAGVDAIYTSQFRRTAETVGPLAERTGVAVTVVPVEDAVVSSRQLARRLLADHAGHTVVVAGHSNTVPPIVEALGGGPVPPIPEHRYDDLYVVTVGAERVSTLHLRYGAPTPAPERP